MPKLATIGYEGLAFETFLQTLKSARISRVFDIRELPLSRKKGFSKSALSERLERAGIAYLHIKALGDPKPGRDAARRGDYSQFKRIYAGHLKTVAAQEAITQLGETALQAKSCLLCYEADPVHCHRDIVASRLSKEFGLEIEHLFAKPTLDSTNGQRRSRRSLRAREGTTASQHQTR